MFKKSKDLEDTKLIARYTKNLTVKNSKAWEMLQTVENNVDDWSVGKSNRWIGYAQCILVAEGRATIHTLREDIRQIVAREN